MTLEMAKGEKTYAPEDFKKVEGDLFNEVVTKLEAVDNTDKIEEIRKEIENQNQPTVVPSASSNQ